MQLDDLNTCPARLLKPGDRVLVVATVVKVMDASQTVDIVVEVQPGFGISITDNNLLHNQTEPIVQHP